MRQCYIADNVKTPFLSRMQQGMDIQCVRLMRHLGSPGSLCDVSTEVGDSATNAKRETCSSLYCMLSKAQHGTRLHAGRYALHRDSNLCTTKVEQKSRKL